MFTVKPRVKHHGQCGVVEVSISDLGNGPRPAFWHSQFVKVLIGTFVFHRIVGTVHDARIRHCGTRTSP
jgi:hypothetical protein